MRWTRHRMSCPSFVELLPCTFIQETYTTLDRLQRILNSYTPLYTHAARGAQFSNMCRENYEFHSYVPVGPPGALSLPLLRFVAPSTEARDPGRDPSWRGAITRSPPTRLSTLSTSPASQRRRDNPREPRPSSTWHAHMRGGANSMPPGEAGMLMKVSRHRRPNRSPPSAQHLQEQACRPPRPADRRGVRQPIGCRSSPG